MTKPVIGEPTPALQVATFVVTLAMGLVPAWRVAAIDSTWNAATSSGVWNTAANWSGGQVPNAAGDVARFPTPPRTIITVSLPADVTLGKLIFENAIRSIAVQGTAELTFDNPGPDAAEIQFSTSTSTASNTISAAIQIADAEGLAVDVGQGKTLLLSNGIASSGGDLIKRGVGSLQLAGNSGAWAGRLIVDAGVLRVESPASVGASSGGILVNPQGTLLLIHDGDLTREPIQLAGGHLRAEPQGFNQPSILGAIVVSADSRISTTRFVDITGNISGAGGLQFSGGTTIIRGDNTYAGASTVSAGRVDVHTATGLGAASQGTVLENGGVLNLHAATAEPIVLRGGTLNFQTPASAAGPLTLQSGLVALSNAADYGLPVTLEQSTADAAILGRGLLFTGGVAGSGDLKLRGNLIVSGAPLAHDGDLIIENAESQLITLESPNSFTGSLIVSGRVAISHPQAASRPTIVNNGELRINRPELVFTPEIRIGRGIISNQGEISGPVILENHALGTPRLSGGRFTGVISGAADVVVEGREGNDQTITGQNTFDGIAWSSYGVVNANSSTAFGTSNWATVVTNGTLNVNQSTSEQFYVGGSGLLNLNASIERAPRFLVHSSPSSSEPRVAINAPSSFEEGMTVAQGRLEVNAQVAAESLTVRNRGRITVAAGASFDLGGGEVDLREGRIEGTFTRAPVLRKTTSFGAELGAMPQFSGDIVVEEGLLEVYPGAFGTTAGVTRVRNDGQLMLRGVGTIADDIFLENAAGPLNRGGLFAGGVCCSGTTTNLTGRLHLGDQGSILGAGGNGSDGKFDVYSAVEGGSLTTWGTGVAVRLLNGNNQYTGVTDVRQGYLQLAGNGRLSQTSAIVLHEGKEHTDGMLQINNHEAATSVDRIDAAVPVEFRGGNFYMFGGGSEAFGTIRLAAGHAEWDVRDATISAQRIERSPGGTLHAVLMAPMSLAEAPATVDGLLPWMTLVTPPDPFQGPYYNLFAEYVNGQIRRLNRSTLSSNINAATGSTNVGIPGAGRPVLTADRTVKALLMEGGGILDLGGHTLTVRSGGVSGGDIRNGNITAGADSGRELIFHGSRIDANIVDSPEGPLNVTITAPTGLGGNNAFTGRLTVNQGELYLWNENSLPEGVDLDILGASMRISYTATRAKQLGRVRVAGGGELTQLFTGQRGTGQFSFDEMILEDGSIVVQRLTGNGSMRKTTIGSVGIDVGDRTDASYTGQIDVDEGLLNVLGLPGAKFVVNGGRLRLIESPSAIRLNGGELEFYKLTGPIEVSAPSTMMPTPQFNAPNPALMGPLIGAERLTFNSTVQYLNFDIDAPARLFINRDNPNFSGDIDIRLAEIGVGRPQALGTGDVTVFADGRLSLGGGSGNLLEVANRITLDGGQLRGIPQSRHIGELHVVSPSYVGGLELAGSIFLHNGVPLSTIGDETTRFRGQTRVGADAQLILGRYEGDDRGLVEIGGTIVAAESASVIDIRRGGLDELRFTASLNVPSGRTLEVRLDGEPMSLSLGAGQTISGGGTVLNPIEFGPGSIISPGASPGELHLISPTIGGGAKYAWEFNNLGAQSGAPIGWDLLDVEGTLTFDATPENPWLLNMVSLPPAGAPFWPSNAASWLIAEADSIVGFNPQAVKVTEPAVGRAPAGRYFVSQINGQLFLNYQVPEPSSLTLAAGLALACVRRGRSFLRVDSLRRG